MGKASVMSRLLLAIILLGGRLHEGDELVPLHGEAAQEAEAVAVTRPPLVGDGKGKEVGDRAVKDGDGEGLQRDDAVVLRRAEEKGRPVQADEGSQEFGSASPAPRRVAAAGGGGRNGDMNDDIPF